MTFLKRLSRYGEAFLRLLYPSFCALCQSLIELEERGLCHGCLSKVESLRFRPSEERIRTALAHGDEAWALFRYEGPVKEILHQIKFERRRDLVQIFSASMAQFFARRPRLAGYDLLFPIPLDPERRWQREFNQSALIAERIHRHVAPVSPPPFLLKRQGLVKKRSTTPQSLLGRSSRTSNLNGVFRARFPRQILGKSVLLIDDIFTTGSTLEEAAKTLKEAGADRVGYFALTRALLN